MNSSNLYARLSGNRSAESPTETERPGESGSKKVIRKPRGFLSLVKPFPSIVVAMTIPLAGILYGELHGQSGVQFLVANLGAVTLATISLFLTQAGYQSLNMSEDAAIDRQTDHKSDRAIPSGRISRDEARSLAWGTTLAGVGLAYTVNTELGVFTLAHVAGGICYSLHPIRLKKRLWINLVCQAAARGLLLYPAAFAVFGDPLNPVAWGLGCVTFLLVLSMQNTADFADVDEDRANGITTPAVYHGPRSLVRIMAALAVFSFVTLFGLIYLGVLPNVWSLGLLALPVTWSLRELWNAPERVCSVTGNHSSYVVYYLCLLSMYVLPPIQLSLGH